MTSRSSSKAIGLTLAFSLAKKRVQLLRSPCILGGANKGQNRHSGDMCGGEYSEWDCDFFVDIHGIAIG